MTKKKPIQHTVRGHLRLCKDGKRRRVRKFTRGGNIDNSTQD